MAKARVDFLTGRCSLADHRSGFALVAVTAGETPAVLGRRNARRPGGHPPLIESVKPPATGISSGFG